MVLFGVMVVFVVRTSSLQGRRLYVMLLGGEWNKQVNHKYTFTVRLLGC